MSDCGSLGWQWSSHQVIGQLWSFTEHQEPCWQHAVTFHRFAVITLSRQALTYSVAKSTDTIIH